MSLAGCERAQSEQKAAQEDVYLGEWLMAPCEPTAEDIGRLFADLVDNGSSLARRDFTALLRAYGPGVVLLTLPSLSVMRPTPGDLFADQDSGPYRVRFASPFGTLSSRKTVLDPEGSVRFLVSGQFSIAPNPRVRIAGEPPILEVQFHLTPAGPDRLRIVQMPFRSLHAASGALLKEGDLQSLVAAPLISTLPKPAGAASAKPGSILCLHRWAVLAQTLQSFALAGVAANEQPAWNACWSAFDNLARVGGKELLSAVFSELDHPMQNCRQQWPARASGIECIAKAPDRQTAETCASP